MEAIKLAEEAEKAFTVFHFNGSNGNAKSRTFASMVEGQNIVRYGNAQIECPDGYVLTATRARIPGGWRVEVRTKKG